MTKIGPYSTMHYDIRYDAASAALGHQIAELTPEIVPHITPVTGLPLPETLTIRLVSVEEWMRLWAEHDKQLLQAEIEALSPSATEIAHARIAQQATRGRHRKMPVGAQTVHYDGYASVVVLTDTLRRDGYDTDYLYKLLAHELTHVGQTTAGGMAYHLLTHSPFPRRRPFADRNWIFAGEGYADWADRQITSRILGASVVHGDIAGQDDDMHSQMAALYDRLGRTVSEVIAAVGVQAVNRIWREPHLLPTAAEEHNHWAWQRRLAGLPPGSGGPSDFVSAVIPGMGTRSIPMPASGRAWAGPQPHGR